MVFVGASAMPLRAYAVVNGSIATHPASHTGKFFGYPGVVPVISSNGIDGGIGWALERAGPTDAVVLHAYSATDLGHELYNTAQKGGRDALGEGTRFEVPLVANGKVYVATAARLTVLGLFP
jgi:hypothetical protein